LVEPGNIEAMAAMITETLRNPDAAHAKAMVARTALRERFTVEHMANSVEQLYFRALARRRGTKEVGARPNLQTIN
jgi:glycosyltransferase involved in cell wall biosynthesis